MDSAKGVSSGSRTAALSTSDSESPLKFYDDNVGRYTRLAEEIHFGLEQAVAQANIPIHSITARVKTRQSVAEKIDRKGYRSPDVEIQDIVGIRAVVRFLSDLSRVEEEVDRIFTIVAREDKVAGEAEESFGYMSMHYICTLGPHSTGPRYDSLKGIQFEVQVRTMLMDAWANVSHYLAYKGDASIPPELRRDFFALSGLFYVADQHFELFYGKAIEAKAAATRELTGSEIPGRDLDLNLESAIALFEQIYTDREHSDRETVSEFVEEATAVGYTTVSALAEMLESAFEAAEEYERAHPPSNSSRYADVGIARQAMAIANPAYASDKYKNDKHSLFRDLIR